MLALYTATLAVITLIGTLLSVETRGRDLTDLADAVGSGSTLTAEEEIHIRRQLA